MPLYYDTGPSAATYAGGNTMGSFGNLVLLSLLFGGRRERREFEDILPLLLLFGGCGQMPSAMPPSTISPTTPMPSWAPCGIDPNLLLAALLLGRGHGFHGFFEAREEAEAAPVEARRGRQQTST
jgi:hypothetical protein